MPINGLTTRDQKFPMIGHIRKGDRGGKNGAPRDLDYFRVVFDSAETQAELDFRRTYGAQPKEINILLPFNKIEDCWDAWFEGYTAGRMVARSNGEYFKFLVDTKTGQVEVVNWENAQGEKVPHRLEVGSYVDKNRVVQPIRMKPVGRLHVVIPELERFAYLVAHTTSYYDIQALSEQLLALDALTKGHVAGLPLVLRRRPRMVSCPGDDPRTRVRREHHLLSIEAKPEWVKLMMRNLGTSAFAPLLTAGETPELVSEIPEAQAIDQDEEDQQTSGPGEALTGEFVDHPIEFNTPKAQAPEPETPARNPNARPWTPERVKEVVDQYAGQNMNKPMSDGRKGLVVPMLESCFAADQEARRRVVMNYLTGYAHYGEMPDAYKIALWLWLCPMKDSGGEWRPCPEAQLEAGMILTAADMTAGQQKLF